MTVCLRADVLAGHEGPVTCLAIASFDDDGSCKVLVSGSFDMTIRVWGEGEDGLGGDWMCIRVLRGHGCYVHALVAKGSTIYSSGEDGLIKVWNVNVKHTTGQYEGSDDLPVYSIGLAGQVG